MAVGFSLNHYIEIFPQKNFIYLFLKFYFLQFFEKNVQFYKKIFKIIKKILEICDEM